ncbi:MAG TPA: ABC transporter ATP-binding protein, partial [Ktedonobacteraceae bacterium]|nr:ABC transporter ATP-binding protein [Ktedonobacteraceae bacterium]
MTVQPDNTANFSVSTQPPAILVRGLSFRYRAFDDEPGGNKKAPIAEATENAEQAPAVEDISFTLPAGELMLIAGPSGCGKSTLLKCLNGLIPHSYKGTLTGEIEIAGRSTKGLNLRDLAHSIGTMLQDPDKQILGTTVEQEVAFGLENLNTPRPEMRRKIAEVLQRLRLEKYAKRATFALSGGQRQQVAAAGLLVMQPSIFLFDEPFANLDSRAVDELEELITALRAEGRTVVIVEHRVEEALHLHPDKVLLMKDGRQVFSGTAQEFLAIADPT